MNRTIRVIFVAALSTFGGTGKSEFFDLYSKPYTTLYSQMFWTHLGAVPLPPHIVSRFAGGKVMALTGWEADQVLKGAGPNGTDVSVPITWSYNHHRIARVATAEAHDAHDMLDSSGPEGAWVVQQLRPTESGESARRQLQESTSKFFRHLSDSSRSSSKLSTLEWLGTRL